MIKVAVTHTRMTPRMNARHFPVPIKPICEWSRGATDALSLLQVQTPENGILEPIEALERIKAAFEDSEIPGATEELQELMAQKKKSEHIFIINFLSLLEPLKADYYEGMKDVFRWAKAVYYPYDFSGDNQDPIIEKVIKEIYRGWTKKLVEKAEAQREMVLLERAIHIGSLWRNKGQYFIISEGKVQLIPKGVLVAAGLIEKE